MPANARRRALRAIPEVVIVGQHREATRVADAKLFGHIAESFNPDIMEVFGAEQRRGYHLSVVSLQTALRQDALGIDPLELLSDRVIPGCPLHGREAKRCPLASSCEGDCLRTTQG